MMLVFIIFQGRQTDTAAAQYLLQHSLKKDIFCYIIGACLTVVGSLTSRFKRTITHANYYIIDASIRL